MMSLKHLDNRVDEGLLRHMILNSIRSNKRKFESDYGELVIACDDKNYWRKQIYPYYKANRKTSRDKSPLDWNLIFTSLNKIRDELKDNFPYRVIQVESAEADDIIGTLCMEFGRNLGGDPILILSGDKDFAQLQDYSNVKQFDPVKNRWINVPSARKFLYEHIIRGDSGDGVPNFLSDDDIFVAQGRQKRIMTKKANEWIDMLDKGQTPEDIFDSKQLRNWKRNQTLIDLTRIPNEIQDQILEQYHAQCDKDRSKMFHYFIQHKLKNLTEKIGEF